MKCKLHFNLDILKQPSNKVFVIEQMSKGQADQSINKKIIFLQNDLIKQLMNADQKSFFVVWIKIIYCFRTIENELLISITLLYLQCQLFSVDQQHNLSKLQKSSQSFVKLEWIFKKCAQF
ncbi:unnamed protein product [Paramecium octaurelia]|uniref:Uncharacterized protein n=1 Tax=Paramecium octaurelia TaxID=43137 RepID=A0A8S1XME0_PAROT|nr:unnamed protein product [Paramecium octaurelia]